jgi:hypothetical protein
VTIKIPRIALIIVLGTVAFIFAVATISYATQEITGDSDYISCISDATERQVDAYEKYVDEVSSTDTEAEYAQHQADFIVLERQYIADARAC